MELKEITKDCIACRACEALAPDYFEVDGNIAKIKKKKVDKADEQKIKEIVDNCPVNAIKLKE
ncbi:ferredoxin [Candidatus Woesearchaeota archaeon]|nr:MAG: ferredoxin [Candidatus Woesearchaeota archaeon]